MSPADPLRRGMILRYESDLYVVVEFVEAQSGKQKPTVHVKLRNLRTGNSLDRTLETLGKLQPVEAEHRQMQYLYASGDERVFMDLQSYEQYGLSLAHVGSAADYLILEKEYRVLMADGKPIALEMPDIVTLSVRDTAAPTHGASPGSAVTKEATLESGKMVRVPLFIKAGDRIRVDAHRGEYVGKES
jgi:elongation factor P